MQVPLAQAERIGFAASGIPLSAKASERRRAQESKRDIDQLVSFLCAARELARGLARRSGRDEKNLPQALEDEFKLLGREIQKYYYRKKIAGVRSSAKSADREGTDTLLREADQYSKKLKEIEANG